MIYKTDYHIHTTFSDGRAIPGDYLPAAAMAGLYEIAFRNENGAVKQFPFKLNANKCYFYT